MIGSPARELELVLGNSPSQNNEDQTGEEFSASTQSVEEISGV